MICFVCKSEFTGSWCEARCTYSEDGSVETYPMCLECYTEYSCQLAEDGTYLMVTDRP